MQVLLKSSIIKNMLRKNFLFVGGVAAVVAISGCMTLDPYTDQKQVSDTTIGVAAGAIGGALIGQMAGGDTQSTLIGAGIGAAVGGAVGNYMDKQNAELRETLRGSGVRVVRVGKDIRLVMPGDITFEHNRSDIRANFYSVLNSVALVLKKFDRTNIKIAGYASRVGDDMYNQELSERRADAVLQYLSAQGVDANRMVAVGYGSRFPVASNATSEGQAQNRRVEITIHQI